MANTTRRDSTSLPQRPKAAQHHATRLEDIGAEATKYVEQSKAANTRRAYQADWADFSAWCEKYRRSALPAAPDTVAYYLADRSQDLKTSTLKRRLATISEAHRMAGHESPNKSSQVRLVWSGIPPAATCVHAGRCELEPVRARRSAPPKKRRYRHRAMEAIAL